MWLEDAEPFRINRVITPILIHYVIFAGDEITNLSVGEIINVREGYWFTEAEVVVIMPLLLAWPMETGNRYLIYLNLSDGDGETFFQQ